LADGLPHTETVTTIPLTKGPLYRASSKVAAGCFLCGREASSVCQKDAMTLDIRAFSYIPGLGTDGADERFRAGGTGDQRHDLL
jgi:hypothetical protein